MQPIVSSALNTSETLKIFLTSTHNCPKRTALPFLNGVISKKSTSKTRIHSKTYAIKTGALRNGGGIV
jgi:hypothetical protein